MHRLRPRNRRGLALLTGTLLTAATLTFAAPHAGAQPDAQQRAQPEPQPRAEPKAEDFQQVTLAKGEPEMGEPMTLAVLPDLHPRMRSRLDDYQLDLIGEVAAIPESALCSARRR